MPPKRPSKRAVAAVSSEAVRSGADPGSFQLPPYREAAPAQWFDFAESLMDMRNITDSHFRATLVQQALTYAQQDLIADALKKKREPDGYQLIKAELLRLHEKSEWDRLRELLTITTLGGRTGTELLAATKPLVPKDHSLWYRYHFFSCLPADLQRLLAEEQGTVEQLAARVDELLRKAPNSAAAATIAAAAPEGDVVAAARPQPTKRGWKQKSHPDRKRKRSGNHHGGNGSPKKRTRRPDPASGLCYFHFNFGSGATRCEEPCLRSSEN